MIFFIINLAAFSKAKITRLNSNKHKPSLKNPVFDQNFRKCFFPKISLRLLEVDYSMDCLIVIKQLSWTR